MKSIEAERFSFHGSMDDRKCSATCHSLGMLAMIAILAVAFPFCCIADEALRKNEIVKAADKSLAGEMPEHNQTSIENTLDINLPDGAVLRMVKVEKGTFMMGRKDNYYCHQVTLSHDYWIGCHEITRRQYNAIMRNDSKHLSKDEEELPQTHVLWSSANDFCYKLNHTAGVARPKWYYFSLPTEAQWEYAAGGGKHGKQYPYSGGDDPDAVAWYQKTSGNKPHKVGLKRPNELGIFDMSGNVSEWCLDIFDDYPTEPVTDPQGPRMYNPFKKKRVFRGGCWKNLDEKCGVTYRDNADPSLDAEEMGFRVVLVWDEEGYQKEERARKLEESIDKADNNFKDWLDRNSNKK